MKTKLYLLVPVMVLVLSLGSTDALAQPGNPSSCRGAVWTLSSSAGTIANGGTVTIYANYQGDAGTCPFEGTITINKTSSTVTASPSLPANTNIPECNGDPDAVCGVNGPLPVGTFTLSHSQGTAQQITFNITAITGGHSAGSGVTITVNP